MFKLIVISSALCFSLTSLAVAKPHGNKNNRGQKGYQGQRSHNRRVVAPASYVVNRRYVQRNQRRYRAPRVVVKTRHSRPYYSPAPVVVKRPQRPKYRAPYYSGNGATHNTRYTRTTYRNGQRYGWAPAYYGGIALARQASYLASMTHQSSRHYFRGFFQRQDRMAQMIHNKYEAGLISTQRYQRLMNRLRSIEENRAHFLANGWLAANEQSELSRQQNLLSLRIAQLNAPNGPGYF